MLCFVFQNGQSNGDSSDFSLQTDMNDIVSKILEEDPNVHTIRYVLNLIISKR